MLSLMGAAEGAMAGGMAGGGIGMTTLCVMRASGDEVTDEMAGTFMKTSFVAGAGLGGLMGAMLLDEQPSKSTHNIYTKLND